MPRRLLTPVMLAAVHAALDTLAQQLAGSDGGAVQSLGDPIVFLALPAAVKAIRFRRLATEIAKREERCHPRAKSKGGSWARNSRGSGRGKRPKRG